MFSSFTILALLALVLMLVRVKAQEQGKCDEADENGHLAVADGVDQIWLNNYYNCPNIKTVTIPDSVIAIGQESFAKCSNLHTVNFGNSSQLNSIAIQAFLGADLTSFVVPPLVTKVMFEAFGGNVRLKSWTFEKPCDGESNQGLEIWSKVRHPVNVNMYLLLLPFYIFILQSIIIRTQHHHTNKNPYIFQPLNQHRHSTDVVVSIQLLCRKTPFSPRKAFTQSESMSSIAPSFSAIKPTVTFTATS